MLTLILRRGESDCMRFRARAAESGRRTGTPHRPTTGLVRGICGKARSVRQEPVLRPGRTQSIVLAKRIGGTIHLALGKGYPETGSKNSSAIHWDMVCDLRQGGRVEVDGETFLENGKILVD